MDAFEAAVNSIKFLSAEAVEKAASGHPGTPMALAGITTDLFTRYMRYNPQDPSWANRDRFVLSCGHASMLVYSVLHLAGYPVSKGDLENFRQWDSLTPGHPEFGHTTGVETTTGPLGQGISTAVGMALAAKMLAARVNTKEKAIIDYRVFVLASDGDLMEGVASEASSLGGQWGLDNLIAIYDANNITIDGKAEVAFGEDVQKRYEAYGWNVQRVDGHNPTAVRAALDVATKPIGKPQLIIAHTHIGIGCPTKQDTSSAHGSPLGRTELNGARAAAGWPLEPAFYIPDEAYSLFKARVEAVVPEYKAWQASVNALNGEAKERFTALTTTSIPSDLLAQLVASSETGKSATRASGSKVQQVAAKLLPRMVSGSADLNSSTKTDIKDGGFVAAGNYAGRNLRFGVREHAMGAIANGLSLGGLIPVTSTFLIFSDYLRPTLRLAAMMQRQSVFVFTHDSFYVGEDGPTHQPIEQVASLRLIPNLDVVRPADGLECAGAWAYALQRTDGPTVLALTRQDLPALERPNGFKPEDMLRGGYVVSACEDPTLVLVASGSEVSLACDAKALLEAGGQRVRVVSMLCLEAFLRQDAEYQRSVLGTAKRVTIEAGVRSGLGAVLGPNGIALGIDHYGASAPAETLAEKFGFTPAAVSKAVLAQLNAN
jgi:transketolase